MDIDEMNAIFVFLNYMHNFLISFFMLLSWCWYMLATSEVPITLSAIDAIIVCVLFAFALFCLIIKIIAALKYGIKGSLFIILAGIMSFVLWSIVLFGTNYNIGDISIKVNCLILEVIGIIVSLFAIISQFVQNHITKIIKKQTQNNIQNNTE